MTLLSVFSHTTGCVYVTTFDLSHPCNISSCTILVEARQSLKEDLRELKEHPHLSFI